MQRSTLLLLLGVVFISFGYTTDGGDGASKIHLSDDLLIRTVPGVDVSFYDISNPAEPAEVGSIEIEGNNDIATVDNYLYADAGHDLQVFDIADPSRALKVNAVVGVFDHIVPRQGIGSAPQTAADRRVRGDEVGGMSGCGSGCSTDGRMKASGSRSGGSSGASQSGGTGTGGSLARFIVIDRTLYAVDGNTIKVFDVTNPENPVEIGATEIAEGLETVYASGDYLFVGGRRGMYIYSVDNPTKPEKISEFVHAESCDPVVVDGDRAYVTLRGGTRCGGDRNQLDVIDISDITNPTLIKSIEMTSPYGLAARDGIVMVCDGPAGLEVLRTEGTAGATRCDGLSGLTAFDVIWEDDLLVVTAQEGFWLYDATDPCEIREHGELAFD